MPRTPAARSLLGVCLIALLAFGAYWAFRAPTAVVEPSAALSASAAAPIPSAGYAGSGTCQPCHAAEFRAWQGSHHGLAERPFQRPADAAALDRALSESGTNAHPVRWIGVAPLEQALLELPDGRIQALDLAHDPRKQGWFSIFGGEQRLAGDWGHWTGRGMNWNASCAYCHNTALKKNYQAATDIYQTTFAERGVGCESCHGPMRAHVAAPNQARAALTPLQRLAACGACHARRAELSDAFVPGERFDDHFELEIPGPGDTFYADGQVRDEAYELTSFLGSRMAHAGVSCSDCHDAHSAQLRAPDNSLCLRCHATGERNSPRIDAASHTFHAAGTPGDACVSCHMPQTTYMQRHARRDHGFTIPDPRLTLEHGVPNACTRCHLDKPASWALSVIQKRYGGGSERAVRAHTRSDLVARARDHEPSAKVPLIAVLHDEPIPLWRAVAADLLAGYESEPEALAALLAAARDVDPLVRSHALRALEPARTPNAPQIEASMHAALQDPVRSVRVAAAWALRAELNEDSNAGRDLRKYLELAADQPLGQMQLGAYALARGQAPSAVEHLQRAVHWDSASAPLRHELAVALSQAGRSEDALSASREAARLDPKQPEYAYALGLALSEVGDLPAASAAFERAVTLEPRFARAWYDLGLARDHLGDAPGALAALAQAERAAPGDPEVAQARSVILGRNRR